MLLLIKAKMLKRKTNCLVKSYSTAPSPNGEGEGG